jgi:aryl-alcohol dehydrogenase-like predicted oxidoreductase
MVNRRQFLGITAGAGATLALTPELLRALGLQQSGGKMIQRAIPSTGEMLPVISFAPRPLTPDGPVGARTAPAPTTVDFAALKAVLKSYLDNGGKIVDVLHGGPVGEQAARTATSELGIQDKFLWTTPFNVPSPNPDAAAIRAAMEAKLAKFNVPKIDLVMVGAGDKTQRYLSVLREMKKEGKVRYIGVHHLALPAGSPAPFSDLEPIMRNESIDVVATDYSVVDRRVEQTILPLALERKIAFMAYFPFDRNRILFGTDNTPLPEWAAEFDAKTWAQFFLKYVLSHPGVTIARTGTRNAAHMLDNIGGGIGRLPNDAMRKRMAELVDSLRLKK